MEFTTDHPGMGDCGKEYDKHIKQTHPQFNITKWNYNDNTAPECRPPGGLRVNIFGEQNNMAVYCVLHHFPYKDKEDEYIVRKYIII